MKQLTHLVAEIVGGAESARWRTNNPDENLPERHRGSTFAQVRKANRASMLFFCDIKGMATALRSVLISGGAYSYCAWN